MKLLQPDFEDSQHDYIQRKYHDVAVKSIKETVTVNGSPLDICDGTHSNGLQDTIWHLSFSMVLVVVVVLLKAS